MMIPRNNNDSSDNLNNGAGRTSGRRHNEIAVLPYAPENDVRFMDNFLIQSLESSLQSLSIENHSMPVRERIESSDSFDSASSCSSSLSLAPRTTTPRLPRRLIPKKKPNYSKAIIMHPQTTGRPIVEFNFGAEIPEQLLFPDF